MCTVSWVQQPGGYHLLFNRDEKRTRSRGLGPRTEVHGGTRFIAPLDGDFGGTWVAVNEFGVAACLINGTGSESGATRSRGFVIGEIIAARSGAAMASLLRQVTLSRIKAFTVAILEPDRPAIAADWSGRSLRITERSDWRMPLSSSSYDSGGVCTRRREEFQRRARSAGGVDPALLYWFHASHGDSPGPYSPCMHRPDAETVSFSWITVTRGQIRFFYSPAPPCLQAPGEQQILARAA